MISYKNVNINKNNKKYLIISSNKNLSIIKLIKKEEINLKNKKIFMYLIIIILILLILFVGYFILKKNNNKNKIISEYIPEQEITEEQLRTTIITLYFLDKETLLLAPEARKIDAKDLINNPYEKLINLLIEGPKNENLIKLIPENTKINKAEIIDDVLYLDFSEDFIKEQNLGENQEKLIIKSIVNTLTELTEINKIKILIDGEENLEFPDGGVKFNLEFTRE